MNVRTQARTDVQTNDVAEVTFFSNGKDRRWVATLASASVSGGSALLEVVAIDSNAAETVIWSDLVIDTLPTVLPFGPSGGLRAPAGQDLVIRLAAAGVGNVGRLNVLACGE